MHLLRKIILFFALCGIIVGIFWDELFEQLHGVSHPNVGGSSSGEEECPFVLAGLVNSRSGNVEEFKHVEQGGKGPDVKSMLASLKKTKVIDINDESLRKDLPAMNIDELLEYDGSDPEKPILVGIEDVVIDVTDSKEKYGQGKGYNALAGKIATRAIALSSFSEDDMTNDCSDFTEDQLIQKDQWVSYFLQRYPVVAVISEYQ
mmetsp:Transcript_8014/g.10444  ORF Transcript_8014/g.10444 Transcript_8014/m.10444 type:complete len:204 (-) Transcript_8014:66-677(-)